jgi:hypothetical protein
VTLSDDFREFLQCLNAREARYLVVGGHAVSFHGYPRFTHDVDVIVLPDEANATVLIAALADCGFTGVALQAADFLRDTTVVLGRPPDQIDITTFLKGVDVADARARLTAGLGVLTPALPPAARWSAPPSRRTAAWPRP